MSGGNPSNMYEALLLLVEQGMGGGIPNPPIVGEYALKAIDGDIQWALTSDPDELPLIITAKEDITVSFVKSGSPVLSDDIMYTTDGRNWNEFNLSSLPTITLKAGEQVAFQSSATMTGGSTNNLQFRMTGKADVSGRVANLWTGAYPCLFNSCNIVNVDKGLLNGTNYSTDYAFYRMFQGNENLLNTPELDGTQTEAGEGSFEMMFAYCSSLKSPMDMSQITTIGDDCCAAMYAGCTELEYAEFPNAPASNLCFEHMYADCTSLTSVELPDSVTTLAGLTGPMDYLFNGCSNLSEVTSYLTGTVSNYQWMAGVAETGTFYNEGGATFYRSESGIPQNWTIG